MEPATEDRSATAFTMFLAGLEAGMVAAFFFLVWMGLSALAQRRGFWTSANLLASVFYGPQAIRRGMGFSTISGLALYLLLYSLLGALFALALRDRFPRLRLMLLSTLFGVCWYYVSFHVIWNAVEPLVMRLHIENSTIAGHVIYGALLGRYPVYARVKNAAAQPSEESSGDAASGG